jgi:hypothetical protein
MESLRAFLRYGNHCFRSAFFFRDKSLFMQSVHKVIERLLVIRGLVFGVHGDAPLPRSALKLFEFFPTETAVSVSYSSGLHKIEQVVHCKRSGIKFFEYYSVERA